MNVITLKPRAPRIAATLTDIADMFLYGGYPYEDAGLPFAFSPRIAFLEEGFLCQLIDPAMVSSCQARRLNIEPYRPWDLNVMMDYLDKDRFYFMEKISCEAAIFGIVERDLYRRYLSADIQGLYSYARKFCGFTSIIPPLEKNAAEISDITSIVKDITFDPACPIRDKFIIGVLDWLGKHPAGASIKKK